MQTADSPSSPPDQSPDSPADTRPPMATNHPSDEYGVGTGADGWTIYTPESPLRRPAHLLRDIARDIVAGQELAWRMFLRNIRGLYRQTVLGLFWSFLPPLGYTAIWVFLYRQRVVDFGDDIAANYAVYVLTGMILWQSFFDALQAPLATVQGNRNMLNKLRFPRESLLMVALYEVLFDLAVRTVVLIPILLIAGVNWTMLTLWAPLGAIALVLLGFGMGLMIMPVGVLYQDVGRFLSVISPIWMILTQIIYPPPSGWATSPLNWANPASPLLLLTRDLLVLGNTPHWTTAMIYAGIAALLLFGGLILYRLSLPVLLERMSH